VIVDVSTDQQDLGLQTSLVVDRDAATRLGVNLFAARVHAQRSLGSGKVSTIYNPLNQYHVVMEVAPTTGRIRSELNNTYIVSNVAPKCRFRLRPLGTDQHLPPWSIIRAVPGDDRFLQSRAASLASTATGGRRGRPAADRRAYLNPWQFSGHGQVYKAPSPTCPSCF